MMKFLASVAALFAAATGAALATPGLVTPVPEPGTLALVGVAVAALVASRKSKK